MSPPPDDHPPAQRAPDDHPPADRATAERAATAAIVLAGGRATRFGSDKLAALHQGRPLVWHALAAVGLVAAETVLVLAPGATAPAQPAGEPVPAVVHDPLPDGGPLIGLLAGLRSTRAPVTLVVAGDMPCLDEAILRLLVRRVAADPGRTADRSTTAVVLLDAGRVRPLPCALRVAPALVAAERLVDGGERSLRALLEALAAVGIDEAEWRALDPHGRSLRDVDTPSDLAALDDAASPRPR